MATLLHPICTLVIRGAMTQVPPIGIVCIVPQSFVLRQDYCPAVRKPWTPVCPAAS
jgi:hypothetical protein